mgnify:CR=1 FL=1
MITAILAVKQDFLTAFSGTDGRLESVLTDEGERLQIVEGASGLRVSADTAVRIVANYETLAIGDGDVAGAKLYALLQTVSPVPLAAAEFEEGVKTEPSEIQSIWRGYDYLNIIVKGKNSRAKHLFHFVEDEAVVDEKQRTCQGAVDLVSRGKQQCAGLWQACLSVRPFKAIYDRGRAGGGCPV